LFVNANLSLKVTPKQILEWMADGVGVYGDDGLVAAGDLDMEVTDESYSYNFDDMSASKAAVKTVVASWRAKYPFLDSFPHDDVESLSAHITPLNNISCAINTRISAYETDDYQVVKSRCLLPVIYHAYSALRTTKKHTPPVRKLQDLLLAHGIRALVPHYGTDTALPIV
jgi:hypothetical protein